MAVCSSVPVEPNFQDRRARAVERTQAARLPALVVSHLPNIRYLSGFTGSNALLLLSGRDSLLYTDPRYELQAQDECDCKVQVVRGKFFPALIQTLRRRRIRAAGVEADRLSYHDYRELAGQSDGAIKLTPITGIVEGLRAVKSPAEIEAIRASVQLNSKVYSRVLRLVKPDITELELAAEIEYHMKRLGASGPAFETIVAAGPRSALPHARPTSQPVGTDRLLLIDMGASLNGYASDMTRVVHLGKPGRAARRIYDAVREAQEAALAVVRTGVRAEVVDGAARQALRRWKLDHTFQHSTGHGLGLEIHEEPRIGKKVTKQLQTGMVITVEPGAYIEGYGGVRIEDTVLVTEKGCETLTPTPKELLVL